jgi:hypothetical protein
MMQVYDDTVLTDTDGNKFVPSQFTPDFVVKVDAHSNSPIFMEDSRELAFSLFNAGAISKGRLIELMEPPMKELLLDDIKQQEMAAAAAQAAMPPPEAAPEQPAGPEAGPTPQLRAI